MLNHSPVLILAQIPPPTHGQSVMVGHLVSAAKEHNSVRYLHVNLKLSKDAQDVGRVRPAKLVLLAFCALKALVCCCLRGTRTLYYVPAPGMRGPIIRDVLLLTLLKPFFNHLVLHWHSVGLGEYLLRHPHDRWGRRLFQLLQGHRLSLCLSQSASQDVRCFLPFEIGIVPNGIPDPCPDFDNILSARLDRLAMRRLAVQDATAHQAPIHLLYLGLCLRTKGIFEVLSTSAALTSLLNARHDACPVKLTIAGPFLDKTEQIEFNKAVEETMSALPARLRNLLVVSVPGFTGQNEKRQLLEMADLFIFPTRYENEGLPLTLLESLAFGLPILTTRWRAIPEALPPDYPWFGDHLDSGEMANLAHDAIFSEAFSSLRGWFLEHFTLEAHLTTIFGYLDSGGNCVKKLPELS